MLDVLEALGKLDPAVLAQYAHAVVAMLDKCANIYMRNRNV